MKKFEIHLADWQRILFGQAPPIFLLEVFIRTLIVYIFLLLTLRWLGKRMSGQLTILEMVVMLTLGAIVSVSMQVPDRGIVLSMFVLIGTLIFHRGLSQWGIRSATVEEITQGKISTLLKDGVMDIDEMKRCRISKQQLLAEMRASGFFNLGEVRRVYLEAHGIFATIPMKKVKPGLPTFPPGDDQIFGILIQADDMACTSCGTTNQAQSTSQVCPHCGAQSWTQAVINENTNQ